MSGGWIKFEEALLTDPRVTRLARKLAERDRVQCNGEVPRRYLAQALGAVGILWITGNRHVDEHDVLRLGPADIDGLTGTQGICELLPDDWLKVIDADNVKLPGFHAHNGTVARQKAVDAKRQQRHRSRRTVTRP